MSPLSPRAAATCARILDAATVEFAAHGLAGVRMCAGDDFDDAELIAGDEHGYSDALRGIFDPIAPAVGGALASLSRHIFRAWSSWPG